MIASHSVLCVAREVAIENQRTFFVEETGSRKEIEHDEGEASEIEASPSTFFSASVESPTVNEHVEGASETLSLTAHEVGLVVAEMVTKAYLGAEATCIDVAEAKESESQACLGHEQAMGCGVGDSCSSPLLASYTISCWTAIDTTRTHLSYSCLLLSLSRSSNSLFLRSSSLSRLRAASTLSRSLSSRAAILAAFSSSVSRWKALPST